MKMKLLSAAVGSALLLGAGAAQAGYFSTANNFRGNFVIDQFGVDHPGNAPTTPDPDHSFRIRLTQLDGTVSLQVPRDGYYGVDALAGFHTAVDYDGVPGKDLGVDYATTTHLYSGPISVGNTTSSTVEFNFNGVGTTSLKLNGVSQTIPYLTGNITLSGAGATLFFGQLLGLPGFLANPVSGSVDVSYQVRQDELDVIMDETKLVGGSFENALLALDNHTTTPVGNRNGIIDGTLVADGTLHIPEPASMALLGLGLAGFAASRRRKSA